MCVAVNLSNLAGNSVEPAIVASGNNVYAVWQDVNEILYRRSTECGVNFGATVNLSNNAGASQFPAIASTGVNVYVVWYDDTPANDEILYRKSADSGINFGPTVNLSNNGGSSQFSIYSFS